MDPFHPSLFWRGVERKKLLGDKTHTRAFQSISYPLPLGKKNFLQESLTWYSPLKPMKNGFHPTSFDLSSISTIDTFISLGKLLFEIGMNVFHYIKKAGKTFLFDKKFSADHHDGISTPSFISLLYTFLRLCEFLLNIGVKIRHYIKNSFCVPIGTPSLAPQ